MSEPANPRGECRECGKPLPSGYLCDSPECDRVEGWK